MNGLSLVIALTAVGAGGIRVDWEPGPGGQLYYTIHLEEKLLVPLRDDRKAVVTEVAEGDRQQLRRIQVVFDTTNRRGSTISPSDNSVTFGWRPVADENYNPTGGLDYMIQLTPERLQSLAHGAKLAVDVPAEVTDIRNIYIFVGAEVLPQELLPQSGRTPFGQGRSAGTQAGLETPATLVNDNTTSAERNGSVPLAGSQGTIGGTQRSMDDRRGSLATDSRTSASGQFNDREWRSVQPPSQDLSGESTRRNASTLDRTSPQSTYSGYADRGGRSRYRSGDSNEFVSAALDDRDRSYGPNGFEGSGFDRRDARGDLNRRDQAEYDSRVYGSPDYNGRNYGYDDRDRRGFEREDPRQRLAQRQTLDSMDSGAGRNLVVPASGTSSTQFAQGAGGSSLSAPAAQGTGQPGFAPPQISPNVAASAIPGTLQQPTEDPKEDVRPWTPLILTTLSLFASLGANAYLGWLAWSFFWRYRDAASDVARARYSAVSTRQAA